MATFHIVRAGRCRLLCSGTERQLEVGQLTLLPHGHAYVVCSDGDPEPVPLRDALDDVPSRAGRQLSLGTGDRTVDLLCGGFAVEHHAWNPMFARLPAVFCIDVDEGLAPLVEAMALEASQPRPAGNRVLERLSEVVFVHVLRALARQGPDVGWLRGLADEVVGRALQLLHGAPAHAWSLDELARRVGCSRSVLTERFRTHTGTSPSEYLAGWRVVLATDLLRQTDLSVEQVALKVGYRSPASFSRRFKARTGVAPGQLRRAPDRARAALFDV